MLCLARSGIDRVLHCAPLQGGYVDCCNGVWRIQGSLAVSRGIGDRNLKQWVIAEPETKVLRLKRDCEFLILGSDGLWDKVIFQTNFIFGNIFLKHSLIIIVYIELEF